MAIKVVTEPSVYIVGTQLVEEDRLYEFLDDHDSSWESDARDYPSALIETAGRLCFMSYNKPRPGGNEAYISHILEVGHGSVCEHAVWNFIVTGISRSLSHELVRHRAGWAFSMLSQRYVDESDVSFVCPPELLPLKYEADPRTEYTSESDLLAYREKVAPYYLWRDSCEVSLSYYRQLCDYLAKQDSHKGELSITDRRKIVRQTARSVLPNCTETKIFCTANARALRHFFELRCSRHADVEIRRLAGKLWQEMVREAPALFGDYLQVGLPDGSFELFTEHRKV